MTPPNPNTAPIPTNFYPSLVGLQEVPEEKIIMAAQQMGGVPNSFYLLLLTAEAYKSMGEEPVFLINKSQDMIRVAARELWENPRLLN